MIKSDKKINDQIKGLWSYWRKLEYESRRESRATSENFNQKQQRFKDLLSKPFNICRKNPEKVIEESGIKDWVEEVKHLENQLSDNQIGCIGPVDKKQQKRDERIQKEKILFEKMQRRKKS